VNHVQIKPRRIRANEELATTMLNDVTEHLFILMAKQITTEARCHREKQLSVFPAASPWRDDFRQNAVRRNETICQPSMYLYGVSPVV
jgi:hypothetical protein